jgi:UDP-N-acetylmuramate dehydrogenase
VTPTFADLTTIKVGGPTERFEVAESTEHLLDLVREADARDRSKLLIMGGGSNLVVGDAGWDGLTVQVRSSDLRVDGNLVTADAGVEWDSVVVASLAAGLAGLESLSGIPGSAGGTPVQNVGAFGTLTSQVLQSVRIYDRATGEIEVWGSDRCGFGSHRQSVFKHSDRYVVLSVTFELTPSAQSGPVTFAKIAQRLGIEIGDTAPTKDVRAAVLAQRRVSGSIYDPTDPDTWGTGSFFINPVRRVIPPAARACPTYPDTLGQKMAAAWLIHNAGFAPGYGLDWGRGSVALSSKHALAVSNRGDATTAEVMAFAAHIRAGVEQAFDIRLGPECDLINCSFDDAEERASAFVR